MLLREENGQAETDPTRTDRMRRKDCILLDENKRDMMTIVENTFFTILRVGDTFCGKTTDE